MRKFGERLVLLSNESQETIEERAEALSRFDMLELKAGKPGSTQH
jgi:hypothetical protein